MSRITRRHFILLSGVAAMGGVGYAGWRGVQRVRETSARSKSM